MAKQRLPLSKCKLWWPAWQQGIPFTSFGFGDCVSGDGYQFHIDKDFDSWLCPDGSLMPISGAVLEDCDEGPLKWTSFVIRGDGVVQVNYRVPGQKQAYQIAHYPLEALSFVGDSYSLDE